MRLWLGAPALGCHVACAAAAGSAAPTPRGTRHALIITIGDYGRAEITKLPGTVHDLESARQMAEAMAIPNEHVVVLRDADATKERIHQEIQALAGRVAPGDRVFIYFSGHGTRTFDASVRKDGCTEGLLAADAQVITNVEMAGMLKDVTDKADKLLVFYDACFSGGLATAPLRTRSLSLAGDKLTPKFSAVGAPEICATPSNLRTRSLALVLQSEGSMPENVVHVAASRPDEVSFDSASKGGFATVAWRDCLLGAAGDADHSGGVSVDEVTRCAQTRISAALNNQPGISGQHMTVAGNASFVPAWVGPAFAPLPAIETASLAPNAGAQSQSSPSSPKPAELLAAIHRQRDGGRSVEVTLASPVLKIRRDSINLSVTSLHSGYVYVALAGSDGKSLYLLYPNALDTDNRIKAGRTLALPKGKWLADAGGPVGRDTLLVMVTDAPRDLSALASERSGPFVRTLLDERGRALLQPTMANGTPADNCVDPALAAYQKCSDAFGSALIDIDEVR